MHWFQYIAAKGYDFRIEHRRTYSGLRSRSGYPDFGPHAGPTVFSTPACHIIGDGSY